MNQQQIEEWACEHDLDVRPVQYYHYRLMNSQGEYILDIYFKENKGGNIVRNSTLQWKTNKWFTPRSLKDLEKLL